MMMTDTIRAVAAYAIAMVVVLGGFLFLYNTPETDPDKVVVAGFIGSALTFVFGSEVQTRTARQAASATYAAGLTNGAAAAHAEKTGTSPG
jgi:hypothetical protein